MSLPGSRLPSSSRRSFIRRAIGVGGAASASMALARPSSAFGRQTPGVGGFDHVSIPMRRVEEMVAFYRAFGFRVEQGEQLVSVHFGDQKINFHTPLLWESGYTLRATAAVPPCGDWCWVWEGTREELLEVFERTGTEIDTEGERQGGRDDGRAVGQSVYTRDPDSNLLEFIIYS